MTKKKIGTSNVVDGKARDFFTINDKLDKGIYQLIAEYSGSNSYLPSHDIKKLIVGYYVEITGVQTHYKLENGNRKLKVTGKLLGYADSLSPSGLSGETICVKLGLLENKDESINEQVLDGISLNIDGYDDNTVITDSTGGFTLNLTIPTYYTEPHYKLIVYFKGNDDYVSTIATSDLYLDKLPTYVTLTPYPSTHINSNGIVILEAMVYLQEDLDVYGNIPSTVTAIREGRVKFFVSDDNITWQTVSSSNIQFIVTDILSNDGVGTCRIVFNEDTDSTVIKYIKCEYSGANAGFGYATSVSEVIQLRVDSYGVSSSPIEMILNAFNKETQTLYLNAEEIAARNITVKYIDTGLPVDEKNLEYSINKVE